MSSPSSATISPPPSTRSPRRPGLSFAEADRPYAPNVAAGDKPAGDRRRGSIALQGGWCRTPRRTAGTPAGSSRDGLLVAAKRRPGMSCDSASFMSPVARGRPSTTCGRSCPGPCLVSSLFGPGRVTAENRTCTSNSVYGCDWFRWHPEKRSPESTYSLKGGHACPAPHNYRTFDTFGLARQRYGSWIPRFPLDIAKVR